MIIMMAWRKVVGNVQWVQSEVQPSLCTQLTSEVNSSNKGFCEGLNYHTATKFFSPFFFCSNHDFGWMEAKNEFFLICLFTSELAF